MKLTQKRNGTANGFTARLARLESEAQGLREQLAVERADFELQQRTAIETQRELECSRERYADLYDSAPIAFVSLDRNGFIHEANLTAARMLGVDRWKLLHTLLMRFVVKDDRRKVLQHLTRCRRSCGVEQVVTELQVDCADGRRLDIALTSLTQARPAKQQPLVRFRTALLDVTDRKRGEAALRTSEEQYRLLFQSNPSPMWIFDESSLEFLAVNQAAVEHYGWSHEEFLCMTVKDIRPPEEVPKLLEKLAEQRRSRESFVGEWRHWKKDHTTLDVEVTISCLAFRERDARLTMVNDITQRKRAEQALRESERRLAMAASGSRLGMFEWDLADGQTLWNEQIAGLLGHRTKRKTTAAALTLRHHYRDWARRVHPEDLPRVEAQLHRCLTRRLPFEAEYRVVWPDKSVHWLQSRGVFLNGPSGKVERMLGIVMDITERKRVEKSLQDLSAALENRVAERTQELLETNERLTSIFDTASFGIITLDEHGAITSLNPTAVRILGYEPGENLGRNVGELLVAPGQTPGQDFLAHYLRHREGKLLGNPSEVLGVHKDGAGLILEVTMTELVHDGRQQFVLILRDITRRKRLERELLEVGDRERQRIGHDLHDGLGQHLHAIHWMASLLQRELEKGNRIQTREVGRLTRHLEEALELMRNLARGLQPVSPVPDGLMCALRELAERTRGLYRIDCRFECRSPVLVERHSAANHLYRIAQEAVNNAIKHAKPTRVRIKLAASRQRIVLGVQDNGAGIRRQTRPPRGMGLHVMQYRADAINGSLTVQKLAQGGTEVVCAAERQALLSLENKS